MKPATGWLTLLAMAAVVSVGFWPARAWLEDGVRTRLTQSYEQQIVSLSERQAAIFAHRLAHTDGRWLEVLVAMSADERPGVAAAAAAELRELVDRWAEPAPPESSTQVAELARLLAQQAPLLPAD